MAQRGQKKRRSRATMAATRSHLSTRFVGSGGGGGGGHAGPSGIGSSSSDSSGSRSGQEVKAMSPRLNVPERRRNMMTSR